MKEKGTHAHNETRLRPLARGQPTRQQSPCLAARAGAPTQRVEGPQAQRGARTAHVTSIVAGID